MGFWSPSSGPGILRAEFSHTVAFLAGWLVGRKKQQEVVVVVTTAGVGVGGWRMCGGDEGGGRRVVGAGVWMRAFWFGGMTGGSVVLVLALVAVVAAAGVVFCCCCHVCHSQLRGGAGRVGCPASEGNEFTGIYGDVASSITLCCCGGDERGPPNAIVYWRSTRLW